MTKVLRAWRRELTAGLLVLAAIVLLAAPTPALAHTGRHAETMARHSASHGAISATVDGAISAKSERFAATEVSASTGHCADPFGHGASADCCGGAACHPTPGAIAAAASLSAPVMRALERHLDPSPLRSGIAGSPALRPPSSSV